MECNSISGAVNGVNVLGIPKSTSGTVKGLIKVFFWMLINWIFYMSKYFSNITHKFWIVESRWPVREHMVNSNRE